MNIIGFALFGLIVAWVIHVFRQDARSGMSLVLGLVVFLPTSLRIELPAGLPQFTIHRVLIVIALIFLIRTRNIGVSKRKIPFWNLLLLFGLSQFVSLILGSHFILGLKSFSLYAIEGVVFYILISRFVHDPNNIDRSILSICYGLSAVAVFAAIEKYLGFNVCNEVLSLPGVTRVHSKTIDITSTYGHRILLGYAMAMGVPLALALSSTLDETRLRRLMYFSALVMIAAAYFSTSRGPWLGLGMGLLGMATLGGRRMWSKLVFIPIVAVVILVLRPGVYSTIHGLTSSTFDEDSLKGSSYNYRWELWGTAWKEIGKSPEQTLFGFGPGSSEKMDLSEYWYGQEGWTSSVSVLGYTSWDNNYACDLLELGIVGFSLEVVLLLSIAWNLLSNWRVAHLNARLLHGGITIGCLVFIFAMTNVFIFAPQLKYLFWALVAIGSNLPHVLVSNTLDQVHGALDDASSDISKDDLAFTSKSC